MLQSLNVALILSSLLALPALAQQAPVDCEKSVEHRRFDFWLGAWEVADAEGKLQGHNTIQTVQNGCALREQWLSIRGGTGESINYYHPGEERWHQLWIDGGSSIIDISGNLRDNAMVLEGNIFYLGAGKKKPFRGTWTPLSDGRVRQFFEEQDETGKWQTWFDGYYSKQ